MKNYIILSLLAISIGCTKQEIKFDKETKQHPVSTYAQIDSVLSTIMKVEFEDMDEAYFMETGYTKKLLRMAASSQFYLVTEKDIYKYIVGEVRVQNFVPHDTYYKKNINSHSKYSQHWLIDKQLLYRMLDLQLALTEQNFNPDGFEVRDGHRHPNYNLKRGGATLSQHMAGKATDIVIKDINYDGIENQDDKDIVLKLLNKEIIVNKGGIGRYPGSMVIHFDVRGKRARWDHQKKRK